MSLWSLSHNLLLPSLSSPTEHSRSSTPGRCGQQDCNRPYNISIGGEGGTIFNLPVCVTEANVQVSADRRLGVPSTLNLCLWCASSPQLWQNFADEACAPQVLYLFSSLSYSIIITGLRHSNTCWIGKLNKNSCIFNYLGHNHQYWVV